MLCPSPPSPSSSSSSRNFNDLPPFSVEEFNNLVAVALDGDQFSESLLVLDPEFYSNTSFHVTSPPTPGQSPIIMLSPPVSSPRARTTSGGATFMASRPRLILEKLKRQASALVLRPTPTLKEDSKPESPLQPIPTISPYIHITSSESLFDPDDDISLPHEYDEFVPYLPLVAQYERAALLVKKASSTSLQVPNPIVNTNNKNLTLATYTIFSRPASAVTASTAPTLPAPIPVSTPPSPESAHSLSTASTATDPLTPRTPTFSTQYSSSSSFYSSSSASRSRWSLCTDDSIPIPTPPPYPLFRDHPFARSNIVTDADPFAKGIVQVVRHSNSAQDYHIAQAVNKGKTRSLQHAPAKPPPSGPLPSPPSTDEEGGSLIRMRETEEWTLKLGLAHTLAPPEETSTIANTSASTSLKRASTPHSFLLQPPVQNQHQSPQHRLKPHSHHQSHQQIKPKPKILRIQIEPENVLDVDKDDWTLSLPLSLQPPTAQSAPSSALTFRLPGLSDRERERERERERTVRPRHRSQPGPGKYRKDKQRDKWIRERVSAQSLPQRPAAARYDDGDDGERPRKRASVSFGNLKSFIGEYASAEGGSKVKSTARSPVPVLVPSHRASNTTLHAASVKQKANLRSQASTQKPPPPEPQPQSQPQPYSPAPKAKSTHPHPPCTSDSVSSVSTIVPSQIQQEDHPHHQQVEQQQRQVEHGHEEEDEEERERTIEYALTSASVRSTYAFHPSHSSRSSGSSYSLASFADSGVGIVMSGVALDEGLRWVDGVRLPSTPNLNVDPEMLGMAGRWRAWGIGAGAGRWVVENGVDSDSDDEVEKGKEGEGDGDGDGMSMVSDHTVYYSARSSVVGESAYSSS